MKFALAGLEIRKKKQDAKKFKARQEVKPDPSVAN